MYFHPCLSLILLSPWLCIVNAIQGARNDNLHLAQEKRALQILPDPSSPVWLNASAIDSGSVQAEESLSHNYRIGCDARAGVGLDAQSCFSAVQQIPTDDRQKIWGTADVVPKPDVILPITVVSDDGGCIIFPRPIGKNRSAQASARNVSEAARAVIQECVIPGRIGGAAVNIGGDNKLNILIIKPKTPPVVTCTGTLSTTTALSCRYIMDEMFKSSNEELFGPASPGIRQVTTPPTLRSPDGKCQVFMFTDGDLALTSWRKVWTSIEFIVAMCVRAGKGGETSIPSTLGTLLIEVMDETTSSGLPIQSAGNQAMAVLPSFAQLGKPEDLPLSLVVGTA